MEVELIAITPNAEKVIESAGRTAYLSFDRESDRPLIRGESGGESRVFRADVDNALASVKQRETFQSDGRVWEAVDVWPNSADKFIRMIVRAGHFSVLEHACATFRIRGGSRAFTHQLVRHRMAAFTQQSQRYLNEEHFKIVEPPAIRKNPETHALFSDCMDKARETYIRLQDLGIKNEDARFVLPNAIESEIAVTADLREWRHILELRGGPKAQWEIRHVAIQILKILKDRVPAAFHDLSIDPSRQIVKKSNPT